MRGGTFEIWARWTTTTRGGKEKGKASPTACTRYTLALSWQSILVCSIISN